jgi:predicted lipid-binding transport protein (Tim44 family)
MAYEMIVMAYADGDRKTLKNLLSRDVYDGFVSRRSASAKAARKRSSPPLSASTRPTSSQPR